MESDKTGWKRMVFKNNKVWVEVGQDGNPIIRNGKARIKYQLDQEYEYHVYEKSLKRIGEDHGEKRPGTDSKKSGKSGRKAVDEANDIPENAILVFTDGASSGNPGPAGIGVVLKYMGKEKKISEYIGEATNNIAELEAIRVGLSQIRNRSLPVRVFTDSNYAFGLLALGWKARKNQQLIREIKKLMEGFKDLRIVKVKGHSGVAGNEDADKLATDAIKRAEKNEARASKDTGRKP